MNQHDASSNSPQPSTAFRRRAHLLARALASSAILAAAVPVLAPAPASAETPAAAPAHHKSGENPFVGARWFVDEYSFASSAVRKARGQGDTQSAALLEKIANTGGADWVGDWTPFVENWIGKRVSNIEKAGALPLFVVYNLPHRDCGQYSAGGTRTGDDYRRWIEQFARGIGEHKAVLILEPDGLGLLDKCLSPQQRDERLALYRFAVETFEKLPRAWVYLDAGHSRWLPAEEMAARLTAAGIDAADGFALNVSNYRSTEELLPYGKQIAARVGGKPFVIDTSRNGNGGPDAPAEDEASWCNPPGRALGARPTTATADPQCQAYLWLKKPGESDGTCRGGPKAGAWFLPQALELAKNARW